LSQGLAFVLVIIIGASTFCGNRETLPTLFQREWASEICHEHAGQSSNKDARSSESLGFRRAYDFVLAGIVTGAFGSRSKPSPLGFVAAAA
jgi:hypothetical protein